MKHHLKSSVLTVLSALLVILTFGQATVPAEGLPGKWTMCYDGSFSATHRCNNKVPIDCLFDKNGHFKIKVGNMTRKGRYDLNGTSLLLKYDKTGNLTGDKTEQTIVWIDRNHFYSQEEQGHRGTVYCYFERIQ